MLRRSCTFDLCQDSDCNGDGQRSGGQVRPGGWTWCVRRPAGGDARAWRRSTRGRGPGFDGGAAGC
ncbi:hypothetical protein V6Z11_D09G019000 [Gossypium hirsutum]